MNDEYVFRFTRDGIEIIGTAASLVIKKNGLTIEVPMAVVVELGEQLHAAGEQLERENAEMFKTLFGGKA